MAVGVGSLVCCAGQHWRRSALTWLTVVVIEGINQAFFILDETSGRDRQVDK